MFEAFSTPRNRIRTILILVLCGLLAFAASSLGIDDNPPGILLAVLADITFVLAFVHPWRTSKQFRHLLYAAMVGFLVFVPLQILFDIIATNLGDSSPMYVLLNGGSSVFFILGIMLCLPGLLVGAVGAVVFAIRNRRRPVSHP